MTLYRVTTICKECNTLDQWKTRVKVDFHKLYEVSRCVNCSSNCNAVILKLEIMTGASLIDKAVGGKQ